MWKIVLGFILFAGVTMYMLSTGGEIDMGGEKHGGLIRGAQPVASAIG